MITALDTQTALVLIDLQNGILQLKTVHPTEAIVSQVGKLIQAFREKNLPIVFVNVDTTGAPWTKARKDGGPAFVFKPALPTSGSEVPKVTTAISDTVDHRPGDIYITKKQWNAFYNTALHQELQSRAITGIVLGGIATSIGVEGTARGASELGYNISFAMDATTDVSIEGYQNSQERIFPRLGEVGTVAAILEKLAHLS